MFTLGNLIHSITRNLARSILFVVISFMLICFSGIYFSSIWSNEQLLDNLGKSIPVSATITNMDGSREVGLPISTKRVDNLIDLGVTKPILTAESYGNIDRAKMNIGTGKRSVYIIGANSIDAFTFDEENIELGEGTASEFLAGEDSKCIINSEYAKRNELRIEAGSTLEINLYKAKYDESGYSFEYSEVAPAQLTVAGFYNTELYGGDQNNAPDIICPVQWLRKQYEAAQTSFEYSSAKCTVVNPLLLNDFKTRAENLNYRQVNNQAEFKRAGVALLLNDKMFIETASQIMVNVRMLRLFSVPVIVLLIMLAALISFFLMRSHRQELSIARCLGRKFKKRPGMFSGGEQQRIAIARALASGAMIILADEPTGNLDSENGQMVIDILKKLVAKEGYCVVVVTHDMSIAEQADVVYNLKDGRLI